MSAGGIRYDARWNVPTTADGPRGSLGASNKTLPFVMGARDGSLHVVGTGTPTGTPKLFGSNDYDPGKASQDAYNGTWEDCSSKLTPAMTAPAGAPFSYLIGLDGLPFLAFYWDYTWGAGTGTVRGVWVKED